MLKNNSTIVTGGKEYRFCNRIMEEPKLFESFNQLAEKTFKINFKSAGGEYEPHVLADGNTVCANVSVNQIPFLDRGKRKFYIQLGTVMTGEEYRHHGLSRRLIGEIIGEWKDKCDAIYLFANDSVLDFYPKFGFEVQDEYDFTYKQPGKADSCRRKLSADNPLDAELVYDKYREGNPFSEFTMIENQAVYSFYADGILRDHIYYLEKQSVIVFAGYQPGNVHCYDIFGKTDSTLADILQSVRQQEDDMVSLGFTPKDKTPFICEKHRETDTTLFINGCGENRFKSAKGMFPEMSHA